MPAEPMNLELPNEIEIAKEDVNNTEVCNRKGVNSQIGSQRSSTGAAGKTKTAGKER